MTHHIRPLEFDASLWRPQNFLFKYLGMIGSWETNSCYLKCLQNWNIHQCLVYYFTVQNNVTGPENTYVSVIGTFSPLPSNTVGSRIKIKNHFTDLPQELMVLGERSTPKSITSAHCLHEMDVHESLPMAWWAWKQNKATGWSRV